MGYNKLADHYGRGCTTIRNWASRLGLGNKARVAQPKAARVFVARSPATGKAGRD
jgi:hypothetical protein